MKNNLGPRGGCWFAAIPPIMLGLAIGVFCVLLINTALSQ